MIPDDFPTSAADLTVSTAASKSAYAGAISMILGWLVSSNAAILLGMIVGVVGMYVNWYYKHKADKRMTREHDLRVARLQRGMDTDTDLGDLEDV